MNGMPELFACTCIKHISTNVMKLQATLKQISMKKKHNNLHYDCNLHFYIIWTFFFLFPTSITSEKLQVVQ